MFPLYMYFSISLITLSTEHNGTSSTITVPFFRGLHAINSLPSDAFNSQFGKSNSPHKCFLFFHSFGIVNPELSIFRSIVESDILPRIGIPHSFCLICRL